MDSVYVRLFETYGENVLKEMRSFPPEEIDEFLDALSVREDCRINLYDQLYNYFMDWSANAFSIGLHLGLSLFASDIISE